METYVEEKIVYLDETASILEKVKVVGAEVEAAHLGVPWEAT